MSAKLDPWRDPSHYTTGPIVQCLECGTECHLTVWGKWCFDCNVARIQRISKAFKELSQ